MLPKIKIKKLSETSKFSISAIVQHQKLGNLGNFIFLVIVTFKMLFPIVFYLEFLLVKYITRNVKKNAKKHRKLGNFNHCSIMEYPAKLTY